MSAVVVALVAFAILLAAVVALEGIKAWREVRLAQAHRPTGIRALFGSDGPSARPARSGDAREKLVYADGEESLPGSSVDPDVLKEKVPKYQGPRGFRHDDGTLGG